MTTSAQPEGIQPWLIDILRCPVGLHPVHPGTDVRGQPVLVCEQDCPEPGSRRQYPIENGIPVMLAGAAVVVPASGD